jgi:hypothetical protein
MQTLVVVAVAVASFFLQAIDSDVVMKAYLGTSAWKMDHC